MSPTQCANCGIHCVDIISEPMRDGYHVTGPLRAEYVLCSVSCLTEWAWKQRDAQPKLSKSKP